MKKPANSIGRTIGSAIDLAVDTAVGTVSWAGKHVTSSVLALPGMPTKAQRQHRRLPGTTAGIEAHKDVNVQPTDDKVAIHVIDYSPGEIKKRDVLIAELDAFLAEPTPEAVAVRWINVNGLHAYAIDRFRKTFKFHTLAAEDVLNVPQRPSLDRYEDHLFIITRMIRLLEDERLHSEQVGMFIQNKMVLTFQETAGDVWDPIRTRIDTTDSRLRMHGPDYLAYALLDAVVDHGFPILERYSDRLEVLEDEVLKHGSPNELRQINGIKRELTLLRRVMWPMREVISGLIDEESTMIQPFTRTYLRDVYEHTVQLVDLVETFREMAGGLTDLHMSVVSNRMNEIMKVLTIVASLFVPITFLAGVYGMNFEYIPETQWQYSYPVFWIACVVIVAASLMYFWRKGWIGK